MSAVSVQAQHNQHARGSVRLQGVDIGIANRNVKDEFSSPLPLSQCAYVAGFVRSRSYNIMLHIVGGTVIPDSDTLKFAGTFDPYLVISKPGEHDSNIKAADIEDPNHVLGKKTKVLRSTTSPIWREDFLLDGIEYDEMCKIELKIKNKDNMKSDQSICSTLFSPSDVMAALAQQSQDNNENKVKFHLVGDKGGAVLVAVVLFDPDIAPVLTCLQKKHDETPHSYITINKNNAALLLSSTPLTSNDTPAACRVRR
mmetsp:Transcript_53785/g.69080  ORF Transcript_53785/g.69080 Transcript_53785/m.69080 type:complete len:255 (+) Transcript_53785:15-779(+)